MRQPFFLGPHRGEHLEGHGEEVPRAAARVHQGDFGYAVGPALEDPSSGRALLREAQESELLEQRRARMTASPPGTEGVLEQEPNHVVLGEQLRHGRQLRGADLVPCLVHLPLPFRLPELVDPAQGVVGGEHRGRERGEEVLQTLSPLGGEAES